MAMFGRFAQERHVALDKSLHDRLVEQGRTASEQQDIESLREIISMIVRNRMPNDTESSGVAMLAGLMR